MGCRSSPAKQMNWHALTRLNSLNELGRWGRGSSCWRPENHASFGWGNFGHAKIDVIFRLMWIGIPHPMNRLLCLRIRDVAFINPPILTAFENACRTRDRVALVMRNSPKTDL